ncbi:probable G-protein coupled receptor 82 [Triplophysa rosa]|uniref:probable G-protein coupled receptor 82 n=1 Tax=Triplophysa rosa TaxID=992332 RepID=UPI002545F0E6|nr:probable G-protein coupled receptor 82 [Triplophysa rosa]
MPMQSFIAMNASGANDSAINESACLILPEERHETILPWLYLSLALLGLPTNGIVLLDLWRSERTPTVIFTLNIVVSDLMLCCSFFLRVAYYKKNVKWPSGSSVCNAVDLIMFSCFYINLYCNMCFLLWTSINRYATVVNPVYSLFRVFKHPKPCWIICLLTWLVVASIVIASMATKLSLRITNGTCFDQVVNSFNLNKIKFITVHSIGVAGFFFILFLMLISYGQLVFYLQRVRGGSLISAGFGPGGGLKVRRKILASVILFVLCFLPYHIQRIIILKSDGGDCQAEFRIKTITIFLAALSSCLQPVLQLVLRLRCCRAKRNARAKPKPEISKSLATPNINTINLTDNAVRQTEKTKNNKGELSPQPTQ